MITSNEQWNLYSTEKPKVGRYVYLLDHQILQIALVTQDLENPRSFPKFQCFECGFFGEPIEYSSNLKWALISYEKFVEVCAVCQVEKIKHMCGKDEHSGCRQYLITAHKAQALLDTKQQRQEAIKENRGRFKFYWFFGILTFFIVIVLLNLQGLTHALATIYGKKFIYTEIARPAIQDTSKELQAIIEALKK